MSADGTEISTCGWETLPCQIISSAHTSALLSEDQWTEQTTIHLRSESHIAHTSPTTCSGNSFSFHVVSSSANTKALKPEAPLTQSIFATSCPSLPVVRISIELASSERTESLIHPPCRLVELEEVEVEFSPVMSNGEIELGRSAVCIVEIASAKLTNCAFEGLHQCGLHLLHSTRYWICPLGWES